MINTIDRSILSNYLSDRNKTSRCRRFGTEFDLINGGTVLLIHFKWDIVWECGSLSAKFQSDNNNTIRCRLTNNRVHTNSSTLCYIFADFGTNFSTISSLLFSSLVRCRFIFFFFFFNIFFSLVVSDRKALICSLAFHTFRHRMYSILNAVSVDFSNSEYFMEFWTSLRSDSIQFIQITSWNCEKVLTNDGLLTTSKSSAGQIKNCIYYSVICFNNNHNYNCG